LTQAAEQIIYLPLNELFPFPHHPFKVLDDEKMQQMIESVKENGIIVPGLVRERKGGGYELVSGHRRKHAAEIAGLETMPVIVKELSDDEAVVAMVNANLQREEILPSEKAFAYKMKMEALSHQGKNDKTTSRQVVDKLKSADMIGRDTGESGRQIQRYIRLTELLPELLELADRKKLKFNPAVELSYLKQEEQKILLDEMNVQETVPSLYQSQQIKRLSSDGMCTKEAIHAILVVAPIKDRSVTIKEEKIMQYFSSGTSNEEIERTIYRLLEEWSEGKINLKGA
jgi:ParB family chromosome partitioning protein